MEKPLNESLIFFLAVRISLSKQSGGKEKRIEILNPPRRESFFVKRLELQRANPNTFSLSYESEKAPAQDLLT